MIFMREQRITKIIQEHVMLILTRRVGETIKAPDHIAVHREEIYQRLMGDNPGNHSGNE